MTLGFDMRYFKIVCSGSNLALWCSGKKPCASAPDCVYWQGYLKQLHTRRLRREFRLLTMVRGVGLRVLTPLACVDLPVKTTVLAITVHRISGHNGVAYCVSVTILAQVLGAGNNQC